MNCLAENAGKIVVSIFFSPIAGLIAMTVCGHKNLVLLQKKSRRVRCRSCHLTISEAELDGDCCPECYENRGVKEYGFDPVPPPPEDGVTYRCEDCGAMIEC